MLKRLGVAAKLAAIGLAAFTLAGCGINTIPAQDEQVKAAWGEVQNQYQRRADLIPNLVSTVQAYANQERDVLTAVTEARARATQVQVDASTITDPAAFRQFQAAQDQLSGVLGRLLAISERYPELRSNQNFLALQSQLEGTENRIAVARRDLHIAEEAADRLADRPSLELLLQCLADLVDRFSSLLGISEHAL